MKGLLNGNRTPHQLIVATKVAAGTTSPGRGIEILTPRQVEADYGIPTNTQAVWRCHKSYGWHLLVIRIGRSIRYSREDVEAWVASRRGSEVGK